MYRQISGLFWLFSLASADWQFKSRPDLAPPRLNITIPAAPTVEKGYLFLAPFAGLPDTPTEQHGPRQAGPYIFRDDGELIWSGYGIYSIWATNFQAGRWKGEDILFSFEGDHNPGYGHGHGHTTILNKHYDTVRELKAGNHKLTDKHEFHIIGEKTGLIQIYQPVPRDLTPWGASEEQQWIVNAIIQELDIETGELLFEWASLDHVTPDEAVLPLNPGQAGSGYNSSDAWDYFHINSVDKDADGNYIVSARDACSVHKISGSTGEILWRLDGKNSSFTLGPNATFCFQHHARFLPNPTGDPAVEFISLYDNSAHGTEHNGGSEVHTAPTSSGKILRLNTTDWTAELVQGFYPPPGTGLLSKSQGSTQVLPNGNVVVNWGSEGALTEYLPDGTPIFHTYFDSGALGEGVQNYRGFRYNWTGLPSEDPAILALENADGSGTTVYVSWNGDTETRVWRFFEFEGENGSRKLLGEAEREGFETALKLPGRRVKKVVADAVDGNGKVLRTTGLITPEREVLKAIPHRGKDRQQQQFLNIGYGQ
ncbi:Secreted protein [Lasiodiplodia theobromae]|uniref:Secreted protein n=1 Tax=Lasiodiplodia theobromae TaxID=45133 RepID=UPI0015C3C506|nr:Secreted protein [Lasiodiplodia theobromae]KAF4541305.1 Secreted protein [Lasiodiplodia theobromae]